MNPFKKTRSSEKSKCENSDKTTRVSQDSLRDSSIHDDKEIPSRTYSWSALDQEDEHVYKAISALHRSFFNADVCHDFRQAKYKKKFLDAFSVAVNAFQCADGFVLRVASRKDETTNQSTPCLSCVAVTGMTWHDVSRKMYTDWLECHSELLFFDMDAMYARSLKTRKVFYTNSPMGYRDEDPVLPDFSSPQQDQMGRGEKGLPKGHPPLKNFWSAPIHNPESPEDIIGILALANYTHDGGKGFDDSFAKRVQPLELAAKSFIRFINAQLQREDSIRQRAQIEAQIEFQRAQERHQTEILAQISHDLRTPLFASTITMEDLARDIGIMRSAHLNNDQGLSKTLEGWQTQLNISLTAGAQLQSMLDDILELAKPERTTGGMKLVEFDIRQLIHDTLHLFGAQAKSVEVRLTSSVDLVVPQVLFGDVARLKRILLNLVNNALKFTKNGTVTVAIGGHQKPSTTLSDRSYLFAPSTAAAAAVAGQGGSSVFVMEGSVTDTGVGIEDSIQKTLFQSFQENPASNTILGSTQRVSGSPHGFGLGLSIVKKFTELMDGTVSVHSRVGEGSTFWFRPKFLIPPLPSSQMRKDLVSDLSDVPTSSSKNEGGHHRDNAPPDSFTPRLTPSPSKTRLLKNPHSLPAVGRLRILVAEDTPLLQKTMENILGKMGFHVTIAGDGEAAVSCCVLAAGSFEGRPFDLIFMDYHMPVKDGLQATKDLRKVFSSERVPIVGLTADCRDETREMCLASGMNDFLKKPCKPRELFEIIVKHCGHRGPNSN